MARPSAGACVRIAAWSGPRALSTALMRSWESRADTTVVDEPLYAYYLTRTGIEHPGRDEIVASQPTDWRPVLDAITAGALPAGTTISYQKHMAHHLLDEVDREPLAGLRHAFVIRDPAAVLASYARVRDSPTLADLGVAQQVELHRRFGGPVLDAADLLRSPGAALQALCGALGVGFDPAMLAWPSGPRPSDGVWGPHWYGSLWASTGFGAPAGPPPQPPAHLVGLLRECRGLYDELWQQRIRVG